MSWARESVAGTTMWQWAASSHFFQRNVCFTADGRKTAGPASGQWLTSGETRLRVPGPGPFARQQHRERTSTPVFAEERFEVGQPGASEEVRDDECGEVRDLADFDLPVPLQGSSRSALTPPASPRRPSRRSAGLLRRASAP